MTEEEKIFNCVNARVIRQKLLESLHLTAGELAKATGIGYQRIYDLGSGRTQKFNPGVVKAITKAFPRVSSHFLYTGDGPVLLPEEKVVENPQKSPVKEVGEMLKLQTRLLNLMEKIDARQAALVELHERLLRMEEELSRRRDELDKRPRRKS